MFTNQRVPDPSVSSKWANNYISFTEAGADNYISFTEAGTADEKRRRHLSHAALPSSSMALASATTAVAVDTPRVLFNFGLLLTAWHSLLTLLYHQLPIVLSVAFVALPLRPSKVTQSAKILRAVRFDLFHFGFFFFHISASPAFGPIISSLNNPLIIPLLSTCTLMEPILLGEKIEENP